MEYPILPFTGEISYPCFKACQIFFLRPLKSAYEVSPVKLHLGYFAPPDSCGLNQNFLASSPAHSLRKHTKGFQIRGEMGANWDSRDGGKMGINLQLVDVICPCSEGWEGPDVCFQSSLCTVCKGLFRSLS